MLACSSVDYWSCITFSRPPDTKTNRRNDYLTIHAHHLFQEPIMLFIHTWAGESLEGGDLLEETLELSCRKPPDRWHLSCCCCTGFRFCSCWGETNICLFCCFPEGGWRGTVCAVVFKLLGVVLAILLFLMPDVERLLVLFVFLGDIWLLLLLLGVTPRFELFLAGFLVTFDWWWGTLPGGACFCSNNLSSLSWSSWLCCCFCFRTCCFCCCDWCCCCCLCWGGTGESLLFMLLFSATRRCSPGLKTRKKRYQYPCYP